MDNYNIRYIPAEDVVSLRESWLILESGNDMTYFQSYDWYEMLVTLNKKKHWWFDIVFADIKKGQRTVLIAPLMVVKYRVCKNYKKGVYFFCNQGWSDYCNFIYEKLDTDALDALFDSLKKKYNVSYCYLDFMQESSEAFVYLQKKHVCKLRSRVECVRLSIPESMEDYLKMLSKRSRQNIRTAYNRSNTDNIKIDFFFDDSSVDRNAFKMYRKERVSNKNNHNSNIIELLKRIKNQIRDKLSFKYRTYMPIDTDKHSKFLTAKNHNDGELCSSFNYGICNHRKEIVLMSVSTNNKYRRYSIGIQVLFEFIKANIQTRDVEWIDFTRGDESYKYMLGGVSHYCSCFSFKL